MNPPQSARQMEHRHLLIGDNLVQLIKSSRGLYENETLFIALGDVRHDDDDDGRLRADALCLRKCDIRCRPAAGAENVSRFVVDPPKGDPEDADEFYADIINKLLLASELEMNTNEVRFPVGYVPVHTATVVSNKNSVDIFLQTEDGFPAVQVLGIDRHPVATKICKVLQTLGFVASPESLRTFQFLGMDSLHIANFEFAIKEAFPRANLPFGTCLRVNTIPKLVSFLKSSQKRKGQSPKIPRVDWRAKCRLSSSQRRFYFLHELYPDQIEQLIESLSILLERTAVKDLRNSVNTIISRHSVLHTIYKHNEQFVCSLTESYYSVDEGNSVQNMQIKNLDTIPMRLSFKGGYLNISMHHIMTDGVSISLLTNELLSPSPQHPYLQYIDYANYENNRDFTNGLKFWKKRLSNTEVPTLDELPVKEDTRSCSTFTLAMRNLNAGTETPFTVFIALYKMLIYKLYGYEDYQVGIAVANRNHPELSKVQGCFINTIVLRKAVAPTESIEKNITSINEELQTCLQHQDVPFDLVVSEVRADRSTDSPLFDILFILDDFNEGGLPVRIEEKKTCLYKQIWYLRKSQGSWEVKVEFRNSIYKPEKVLKQMKLLCHLAGELNSLRSIKLCDIALNIEEIPSEICDFPLVHPTAIIAKQVEMKGSSSVQDSQEATSLFDLYTSSKQLAYSFADEIWKKTGEGIQSDFSVVLYLERNIELIKVILALWSLGVAVVPISRDWPEERVDELLSQLDAFFITDSSSLVSTKNLNHTSRSRFTNGRVHQRNTLNDLLYMTFTSGSTGTPKAVCTEAKGLSNLIINYSRTFLFNHCKMLYQVVNYSFDIFFADILQVLFNGGNCRLAMSKIPNPVEMGALTHAYIMPAYLSSMDQKHHAKLKSLEVIQYGGEPIQEQFKESAISEGINLYQQFGITEHTVYSHTKRAKKNDDRNDIGKPFYNYRFKLTDKDAQIMPNGFRGYFNTGGVGLFRGYFGKSQPSSDWFNTGDLMTYEHKKLMFHGRQDFQVKILGHRIELAEIEVVITSLKEVSACVVTARPHLIAYIVLKTTESEKRMRCKLTSYLEDRFPHYMVPRKVFFIDSFPLNSNGKIDHQKLSQLGSDNEEPSKGTSPKTSNKQVEHVIRRTLLKYLKIRDIRTDQNVFEAGANSLHILLTLQELKEKHGIGIQLKDVFKLKTIEKLSSVAKSVDLIHHIRAHRHEQKFPVPADHNQQAQWFIAKQAGPHNEQYLLTFKMRYDIGFHLQKFIRAMNAVISTHRALRTVVYAEGADIYQAVLSRTETYVLLSPYVGNLRIDITHEVPIKIKISEDPAEITVVFHHVTVDGFSLSIVAESLAEAYNTGRPLPPVNDCPKRQTDEEGIAYWTSQLSDVQKPVKLPVDFKKSNTLGTNAKFLTSILNIDHKKFNERKDFSILTVYIASYALLIRQLTARRVLTIGVPFANRTPDNQNIVGNLVNTICLKIDTNFKTLADYMDHVNDTILNAHKHQSVPFETIVQKLNPDRDFDQHPLFTTMFVLNNTSLKTFPKMNNCTFEVSEVLSNSAKFDMTWFVEGQQLKVEYNSDLFKETSVKKFIDNFQVLLSRILQDYDDINNILSDPKPKLRKDKQNDYPNDWTFGRIYEKQSLRSIDETLIKLHLNGMTLSYQKAYQLAQEGSRKIMRKIIQRTGEEVRPDDVIAICYSEGLENHLGILISLILGCAYVPLDPANPVLRNEEILVDSGALILLASDFNQYSDIPIFDLKTLNKSTNYRPLWPRSTSNNLAYVIYTSGTTGKPKGVCVESRGVINTIENVTRYYNVHHGQSILQYTKYSFDASIAYTYAAFCNGSRLLISPPEQKIKEKIGIFHMTPILLQDYSSQGIDKLKSYVETWSVGGDVLPDACMNRVIDSGIPLVQVYGPTEVTILQCMAKMKKISHVGRVIGRPISNFNWTLMGSSEVDPNEPVEGEFLMAGANLARGYKNSSELTDSVFVHRRSLYKSGDVVKRLPSGHFVYQYRRDKQKKVRGYRVDLSEIENTLAEVVSIGSFATDYVEVDENTHIAIYYTGDISAAQIREYLMEKLPHYMQPTYIKKVESIPINSNSKVDRSRLPNPNEIRKTDSSEQGNHVDVDGKDKTPTSSGIITESVVLQAVTTIWKTTLKKESISPFSNFYAEGGHSIKAALISHQIEEQLKISCPVELIFKHPNIHGFTTALLQSIPHKTAIPQIANKKPFSTTVNPFQMYMLKLYANRANENRLSYNSNFTIKVSRTLRQEALNARINSIIMSQTALRSVFLKIVNEEFQYASEVLSGTECFISLKAPASSEEIDLFKNPPLAIHFHDSILSFKISHVIEDGRSFNILAKQLLQNHPPNKVFDYYTARMKVIPESLDYWKKKTDSFVMNKLEVNPYGPKEANHAVVVERTLSGLFEIIEHQSQVNNCSAFLIILHAFIKAVKKRIERPNERFAVGIPVDLRSDMDEQETVGYFVNTVPLIVPSGNDDLSVETTKSLFEEAYSHRYVPYDLISKESLFDVMLASDNSKSQQLHKSADYEVIDTEIQATKFPLTFFVSIERPLQVRVEYKSSLFHKEYVEDLIENWKDMLLEKRLTKLNIDVRRSEFPNGFTFDQLLVNQSRLSPGHIAFTEADTQLDYETVVHKIEHYTQLLRRQFVEATGELILADDAIPIVSSKSIQTTISCLAIISAGAAYTPVDKHNPMKRIEGILDSLDSFIYVADEDMDIPQKKSITLNDTKGVGNARYHKTVLSSDLAYVINTSGTQGAPKAVAIEHRSIANLAVQSTKTFNMNPQDAVYHFTNFAYDNSVLELVMAVTNGAKLFYPDGYFTADNFWIDVDKQRITHALLFPGLVSTFEDHQLKTLRELRYWIVGAEKVSQRLLDRVLDLGTDVVQNYGPTESTAYILWRRMKMLDYAQNLGRPIDNACCFIDAPTFKAGTLLIGGAGLLRGYLNVEKQPFVDINGHRMLPTTDLVRRLPNGEVVFVGRNDTQVKIRGQRVDLTEVEEALQTHSGVQEAKVRFIEEKQKLIGYYTTTSPSLHSKELLQYLKSRLPIYMLPSSFVHLDKFPLTANAKVDMKALPVESDSSKRKQEVLFEIPNTLTEFQLWKIWKEEFRSEHIGIEDDFFLLGGNSLLAQAVVAKIQRTLSKSCTEELLYRYSTVQKLAEILDRDDATATSGAVREVEPKLDYDNIPMSCQQEQMLFLHSIDENFNYNMPFIQHFSHDLDIQRLHIAFHRLIQENEVLRTVLVDDGQRILSMTEVFLPMKVIQLEDEHLEFEVLKLKNVPFDLSHSVLRCGLFKTPKSYVVVLAIHHIATDATSTQLIERKLSELYNTGQEHKNNDNIGSYARFAQKQKNSNFDAMLERMISRLEGRANQTLFEGSSEVHDIKSSEMMLSREQIFRICSAEQITPYVLFTSLLYRSLKNIFHKNDILIGSPVNGRSQPVADTIGYFLNNVVLVVKSANLQQLKEEVKEAMSFSDLPFSLLINKMKLKRHHGRNELYEVYLNCRYGLENEESLTMAEVAPNSHHVLPLSSTHPLEVDVDQFREAFKVTIRLKGKEHFLPLIEDGLKNELAALSAITKVKEIVGTLLKTEPYKLDEEDNFFEVGGNSLLLLKLRNKLNEVFQKSISVLDLLSNQRLTDIANLTCADRQHTSTVSVVHKAIPEDRIFIFLHPLIGGSVAYSNLYPLMISKLPNSSVLAVHPAAEVKEESIEELCKQYIAELKPYFADPDKVALIGASFGGILCYEIAKQTRLPFKIISIDSTANTFQQRRLNFDEHRDQIRSELVEYSISASDAKQIVENSWKLLQMSYEYHPTRKILNDFYQLYIDDPTNGWDRVTKVKSLKIKGTHSTMLMKDNVDSLSDIIGKIL
ncbi:hypothetical protein QR680_000731 [Steinernema hermaphroditum]|uniref:Carrier domain-containing protein n=1 Tax=Steinernema hermaphroditum TaxID=289476 RepID=A0AA39LEQ1_9BILA|nr:hypothetical protein QR680_000731 [Steinernema hermaphroditum]